MVQELKSSLHLATQEVTLERFIKVVGKSETSGLKRG